MSQAGRAAHAHNKARHAQRVFGEAKRKLEPVGSDTLWLPELVARATGLHYITVDSPVCLALGETQAERELALRKASSLGALVMSAYRENGQFVEYRWAVA